VPELDKAHQLPRLVGPCEVGMGIA
jgi:hypothetical protein